MSTNSMLSKRAANLCANMGFILEDMNAEKFSGAPYILQAHRFTTIKQVPTVIFE